MKRIGQVALWLMLATVSAAAQDAQRTPARRDSFWYGRFGYGTIVNDSAFGGVSLGFGRRLERGAFGLDVLLFTGQVKVFGTGPSDLQQTGGAYTHAAAISAATLKALFLVRPWARATPYLGMGAGLGAVSFGRSVDIDERWHGMGLQGELTVGYAFARSEVSTRFFVQADMTHPFYRARRYSDRVVVTGDRDASSFVVSLGAGW